MKICIFKCDFLIGDKVLDYYLDYSENIVTLLKIDPRHYLFNSKKFDFQNFFFCFRDFLFVLRDSKDIFYAIVHHGAKSGDISDFEKYRKCGQKNH